MLRIRLSRVGKKKQPSYRIVVADSRAPRAGAFLQIIGHYDPLTDPATLVVKEERAVHWLQNGAKPSDTAAKLLTRAGVMEKAGKAPAKWDGKQVAPGKKKAAAIAKAGPPPTAPAPAAAPPDKAPAREPEAVGSVPPSEAEAPAAEAQAPQAPDAAATEDAEAGTE